MCKQTISIQPIDLGFIGEVLKQNSMKPKKEEYLETWVSRNYPDVIDRQLTWDIIRKTEAVCFTNICSEWFKALSFGFDKPEIVGEDDFGKPVYENFVIITGLGQTVISALLFNHKKTISHE